LFYEDCMFKQGRGKMRRTIWLLAIAPLIVFYALLTLEVAPVHPAVQAADLRRPLIDPAMNVDQVVVIAKAPVNQEVQILAPLAVTSTVAPTPPRSTVVLPRLTPTASPTVAISETAALSLTAALSQPVTISTQLVTNTAAITTSLAATVTTAATPTSTTDLTATEPVTADPVALDAEYAGPVEGTIIANRTEADVRFFVEGATYNLAPLRSIGLTLPRVTAVLNLFNCDANLPETQEGCFWDPYLLDREQFYEVINGQGATLALQAAGTPPGNQIWLQNRTGKREQIFYEGTTYELPPAGVQELTTEPDTPAILYLRSCLEADERTVCEWVPSDANPGIYYALIEVATTGAVPNSQVNTLQLQPIVADGGTLVAEAAQPQQQQQITCQLLVPVLNVRSGPGLQYQIISKIRSDQQAATVVVTGRDADGQWLAVSDGVAPGGWVAGTSGFVDCEGSVNTLPVAEVTDGRLAPTPVAAPVTEGNTAATTGGNDTVVTEVDQDEAAPVAEATPTAPAQAVPPGQALLVINNGFDQQIRFTLDQRYRVVVGPSEFDLQPGQSISLLVYPGMIAFSASSPWRGLSGNDDFMLEAEQTLNLWVTFVPDPDGSGNWILQF
jgi:uncharacterized protein YraI